MKLAESLEMVVRTDPGVLRPYNEDAVFADPAMGLAILADGMGGYNAGEVASGMAISRLSSDLARILGSNVSQVAMFERSVIEQHLVDEIGAANFAIFNASKSVPRYAGMGTTLVAAWFYNNRMSVAHVGDSRLYRLRGKSFSQLTRDHSLLQEQLDSGMISKEEARCSSNRNLVTRALGVDPTVNVEIQDYGVRVGDIVLLCSDGLSDMVDDGEISLALRTLGGNLPMAADHLIQLANDNGGRDNVSVILVKVRKHYAVSGNWWQRLLACLR